MKTKEPDEDYSAKSSTDPPLGPESTPYGFKNTQMHIKLVVKQLMQCLRNCG